MSTFMITYKEHTPVLLEEIKEFLQGNESILADLTMGYMGHLKMLLGNSTGYIYAFDQDKEAISHSTKFQSDRFVAIHKNFQEAPSFFRENNILLDFILLDLGVSSHQLDSDYRGFSFNKEGPLDMRMGNQDNTAADIINTFSEKDLADIFFFYGEERSSRRFAKAIVEQRKHTPFQTTLELSSFIEKIVPKKYYKIHPATKIFQALRIFTNNELDILKNVLPELFNCLNPKGRMLVISFHSLEDRIVKQTFKELSGNILTKRPIIPTDNEISQNKRSRSAKLRVIEK